MEKAICISEYFTALDVDGWLMPFDHLISNIQLVLLYHESQFQLSQQKTAGISVLQLKWWDCSALLTRQRATLVKVFNSTSLDVVTL